MDFFFKNKIYILMFINIKKAKKFLVRTFSVYSLQKYEIENETTPKHLDLKL